MMEVVAPPGRDEAAFYKTTCHITSKKSLQKMAIAGPTPSPSDPLPWSHRVHKSSAGITVDTVLTPPHPDPFEALLDEPFTGAFDHPRPQRQSQFLVPGIVDMSTVPIQIGIHRRQGMPRCIGQPLDVQGLGQVGEDPVGIAMTQAVS